MPFLVGDDRKGRTVAGCDDLEPGGEGGDLVAVAHPHLMPLTHRPQPVEQRARFGHGEESAAEFAAAFAIDATRLDGAAELVTHHLLAIADAENGKLAVEQCLRRARAVLLGYTGGRARQNDALGSEPVERRLGRVERNDFAIHPRLANPPRDKLGHLAAEIDDQNRIGGRDGHGGAFDGQTNAREP